MRCPSCEPDYCACADFYAGRLAYWKGDLMAEPDECPCAQCQPDKHGWLPIETARRDGTRVLAYWPGCEDDTAGIQNSAFYADSGWAAFGGYKLGHGEPTLWQPLPKLPQS